MRIRKLLLCVCATVLLLCVPAAHAEGAPVETLLSGIIQVSEFTICATPEGLCFDEDGLLYIFDTANHIVFTRDAEGTLTHVAGSEIMKSGYSDDKPLLSRFSACSDGAFAGNNKLIIVDRGNNILRALLRGEVFTYSGTSKPGYREGDRREAMYSMPGGVAAGTSGMYVTDTLNHVVRVADGLGNVRLFAGVPETAGYKDGPVATALFNEPIGIAVGERGEVYVCDSGNQRIRVIEDGIVSTLAGGGEIDPETGYVRSGFADGEDARLCFPAGICYAQGVLYIADAGNHAIRALHADGTLTTVAGTGKPGFTDGANAQFNYPTDVEYFDGRLYVADSLNAAVRCIPIN